MEMSKSFNLILAKGVTPFLSHLSLYGNKNLKFE